MFSRSVTPVALEEPDNGFYGTTQTTRKSVRDVPVGEVMAWGVRVWLRAVEDPCPRQRLLQLDHRRPNFRSLVSAFLEVLRFVAPMKSIIISVNPSSSV